MQIKELSVNQIKKGLRIQEKFDLDYNVNGTVVFSHLTMGPEYIWIRWDNGEIGYFFKEMHTTQNYHVLLDENQQPLYQEISEEDKAIQASADPITLYEIQAVKQSSQDIDRGLYYTSEDLDLIDEMEKKGLPPPAIFPKPGRARPSEK